MSIHVFARICSYIIFYKMILYKYEHISDRFQTRILIIFLF